MWALTRVVVVSVALVEIAETHVVEILELVVLLVEAFRVRVELATPTHRLGIGAPVTAHFRLGQISRVRHPVVAHPLTGTIETNTLEFSFLISI